MGGWERENKDEHPFDVVAVKDEHPFDVAEDKDEHPFDVVVGLNTLNRSGGFTHTEFRLHHHCFDSEDKIPALPRNPVECYLDHTHSLL